MTSVEVRFEWLPNGEVHLEGSALAFPPMPQQPGLYRYRFVAPGRVTVYIGEAVDLRRRADGYRRGYERQATNRRINARMRAHLAAGGRIDVAVATQASLAVDGTARALDLSRKASRLLAENAAIHAVPAGESLENLPGVGDPEG